MKGLLVVLAAVALGLFMTTNSTQAQATRIEFEESQVACIITGYGEVTSAGGTVHVRGLTEQCDHPANIPQLVGTDYMVIDADLDETGSGPIRLTWRLETQGFDGGWEGVWEGYVSYFGTPYMTGGGRGVGHGTGAFEGQHYFSATTLNAVGTYATGYLLLPGQ